jgi:hypothetical protein
MIPNPPFARLTHAGSSRPFPIDNASVQSRRESGIELQSTSPSRSGIEAEGERHPL